MINTPRHCPVCTGARNKPLHDFGVLPQSGIYLDDSAQAYPSRRLAFFYCEDCGCVFQDLSESMRIDYAEVTRGTERQFPIYAQEIVSWATEACEPSRLLIEVGSNDGTFLTRLRQAGVINTVGIEPSVSLAEKSTELGHRVENLPLDMETARQLRDRHGTAHVVICRHTLEHVPDPLGFMHAVRHLLHDEGELFIEVPSVLPAIDARLQVHDFWDEHLTYFSETTLNRIVTAAGFVVERIESRPHCGSENILCWARSGANTQTPPQPSTVELEYCASLSERWERRRLQLQRMADAWPKPVVAMGAAHPQSNFLHFSGLIGQIDGLIDDDPVKIGRWVPAARPVPVVPGGSLKEIAKGGTVLLTGFGYPGWMQEVLEVMSGDSMLVGSKELLLG